MALTLKFWGKAEWEGIEFDSQVKSEGLRDGIEPYGPTSR